jgi:hypothetical protein
VTGNRRLLLPDTLNNLAAYAGALEGIILAMPGRPVLNGQPMEPETALADLRRRFNIPDGTVTREGILVDR